MDKPENLSNSMSNRLADRFRGFLPVIVDVETGGFDAEREDRKSVV